MIYSLPKTDKPAINFTHFPTKHQAFIFRAYEYVPAERIAEVLETSVENVRRCASEMGLPEYEPGKLWLDRGYITIIRRMWHILPYHQLLKLLGMDEETLAMLMYEEDFLWVKLKEKPICETVHYRELTDEERVRTEKIRKIMSELDFSGKKPFEFEYDVPKMSFEGKEFFSTRMIYAFSGLYQRAFDVDSREFLPDDQLAAYQKLGVNGIWTQGVLSQLAPFPFGESASAGYEKRIEKMRELTERLDRYGIKLYLYINEPRSLPVEFFENHPEIRGHVKGDRASLCTSTPEVQKYIKDSVEYICKAVPLVGGFFTITRSENQTNCYSHSGNAKNPCNCVRCSKRSVGEVIGETVGCILEGARRVSDKIKVIAWSWGWGEFNEDVIRYLPKEVIIMSQSERGIPFEIGGCKDVVRDYSMSIIGPGEEAKSEWAFAKKHGHELAAKVQINTTWEASTVPAIPVMPTVKEHMKRLAGQGVQHLMLSWTLGGYPCRNIAAASEYFYEKAVCSENGEETKEAEIRFSKAFSEFPFHISVLYNAPQNAGPSNLLFEKPTGYNSTMTCYPYDDLTSWRGIYPEDVFEEQFRKLCDGWEKGLQMLPPDSESETAVMANAAYCLFKSTLNQIRFVRVRNGGRYAEAAEIAKSELEVTKKMLALMNKNAAIGYEAANHYYFSKGQLAEKIVNCNFVIEYLSEKQ